MPTVGLRMVTGWSARLALAALKATCFTGFHFHQQDAPDFGAPRHLGADERLVWKGHALVGRQKTVETSTGRFVEGFRD